jgi:hypothetical protein
VPAAAGDWASWLQPGAQQPGAAAADAVVLGPKGGKGGAAQTGQQKGQQNGQQGKAADSIFSMLMGKK